MRLDPQTLAHLRATAEEVRALAGDDERAFLDTLEGESDAMEMLDACITGMQETAAMSAASRELAQRLTERARRFSEQERAMRAAARLVLEAIGERKVIRPGATLSVSPGKLSVEVTDERAIPTQLRKPGPPDKTAIRAHLEAGEDVPGARLAVGEATLTVRCS